MHENAFTRRVGMPDLLQSLEAAERVILARSDIITPIPESHLERIADEFLVTLRNVCDGRMAVTDVFRIAQEHLGEVEELFIATNSNYVGPVPDVMVAPVHGVFMLPKFEPLADVVEDLMQQKLRQHFGSLQYASSLRRILNTRVSAANGVGSLVLTPEEAEPFVETGVLLLHADIYIVRAQASIIKGLRALQADEVHQVLGVNGVDLQRGVVVHVSEPKAELPQDDAPSSREEALRQRADRFNS